MYRIITLCSLLYLLNISCQEGTGGESCSDGVLGDREYTIDCGGDCPLCDEFFEGSWKSDGENLSQVWKELFDAQSITANFSASKTYTMTIVNTGGTPVTTSGNYVISDSGIDGIWTLTLNQIAPVAATFDGIMKAVDNYVLNVEIVQTDPYINAIAPTPEGGLGSTKTETGGNTVPFPGNVQTFIRQ